MKTSEQLIPQLRFSEFKENWKIEELDNYINLLSGYAFKGDDISDVNNGIPLLRGINITEGKIRHSIDIDRYYNQTITGLEKYLLEEDDLVLGMDGSKVGKNVSLISKEDAGSLLIQRVARVRAKFTSDIRFIYLNIFSERFHKYVDKVNTSSGIPHISSKQIKEFSIGFPSLPEQQKIVAFLTDVDAKITKLTKKKTLLEQYKKGVMQKIFNQELRFKDDDGNDFADWEEKKLGEIFKITAGGDIDKINVSKEKIENFIYPIFANSEKQKGLYGYSNIYKIDFECVTITGRGSLGHAIARHEKFYPIVRLLVLKPKFRLNVFFFESAINQLNILSESTGVPQLTAPQASSYKVSFPSLEEQTKIANFLSDINIKIEALNTKIENSKTFKKGLLQKMFV